MIKNPGIERPFRRLRAQHLTLIVAFMALLAQPAAAGDTEGEKANAHLLQAEIELQRNQYKAASEEYRKAAELSDDIEIARQATRVSYSYGFNEDALSSAERWLELDEENDEALLYVAQLQLRNGDLRNSRRTFTRLLERGDEPVDERLVALIPFLSEEDPEDSDWLMRQLAKPFKDSASANYAAGVMALQAGDTDEARERAERAIELKADWVQPHLLYARSLLLGGDQDKAIDYTARMVGDDPDPDPEARLELAIMYLAAERDEDALSQVNQVLLEQPARTDALRLMAIINFRQEHLDAAWSDFQDLLSSGRYTMDALFYLARIADRRQEYDQAIALYSQVISGENAVAAQRRASGIMAEEGEPEEGLSHLTEFGETHPNYAIDMMQARAQLLASLERFPEALELYDQVVEYRPDSESVVLGQAELLLRMGELDEAIDAYRNAVKRWPDSAMSMNALGYTLADRTTEYKEAARLIEKALKLQPDSAAIIDSWGWVLYRQGEHERALVELQRAYDTLKDPEVAAHIVEVLWKLERLDEAKKVLDDAEVLFPENELLENIRERVFPETP
ncbi:MAG: tetratricopeptide repeat protein [Woeseia sp.]